MSEKILAWHFLNETLRDGRPVPPDGEMLRHDGPLKLCETGLHASVRLIDALANSPGATVCRVECGGDVTSGTDKLVCRERTILWRVDVEELLRDFARWCAWQVIDEWDAPQIVRDYLRTGDESIRSAAWAAARDVAMYVACDVACDVALAAVRASASAKDAAWAAARDAARDAACAARASASAKDAACAARAAKAAAMASARAAQNAQLTSMVESLHAGSYIQWAAEEPQQ